MRATPRPSLEVAISVRGGRIFEARVRLRHPALDDAFVAVTESFKQPSRASERVALATLLLRRAHVAHRIPGTDFAIALERSTTARTELSSKTSPLLQYGPEKKQTRIKVGEILRSVFKSTRRTITVGGTEQEADVFYLVEDQLADEMVRIDLEGSEDYVAIAGMLKDAGLEGLIASGWIDSSAWRARRRKVGGGISFDSDATPHLVSSLKQRLDRCEPMALAGNTKVVDTLRQIHKEIDTANLLKALSKANHRAVLKARAATLEALLDANSGSPGPACGRIEDAISVLLASPGIDPVLRATTAYRLLVEYLRISRHLSRTTQRDDARSLLQSVKECLGSTLDDSAPVAHCQLLLAAIDLDLQTARDNLDEAAVTIDDFADSVSRLSASRRDCDAMLFVSEWQFFKGISVIEEAYYVDTTSDAMAPRIRTACEHFVSARDALNHAEFTTERTRHYIAHWRVGVLPQSIYAHTLLGSKEGLSTARLLLSELEAAHELIGPPAGGPYELRSRAKRLLLEGDIQLAEGDRDGQVTSYVKSYELINDLLARTPQDTFLAESALFPIEGAAMSAAHGQLPIMSDLFSQLDEFLQRHPNERKNIECLTAVWLAEHFAAMPDSARSRDYMDLALQLSDRRHMWRDAGIVHSELERVRALI